MKIIDNTMRLTWSLVMILIALIIMISGIGYHSIYAYYENNSTQWQVYHIIKSNKLLINQTFDFNYKTINGIVTSIHLKQPFDAIETNISNPNESNGMFEIEIPKNYPYTNENITSPTNLIILLNGKTIKNFNMDIKDCFFDYSIPFTENNSTIDLIFTSIPEYGPLHGNKVSQQCIQKTISQNTDGNIAVIIPEFQFAIPILVISITSLILLHRIKFKTSI